MYAIDTLQLEHNMKKPNKQKKRKQTILHQKRTKSKKQEHFTLWDWMESFLEAIVEVVIDWLT